MRAGRLTLREDAWRLPDGREVTYPVLAVGVTVGVLLSWRRTACYSSAQYRHLLRGDFVELPGGGAGPDEDPRAAAQRELREEAGIGRDGSISSPASSRRNAYLDEVAYCFAAWDLTPDALPADDDEFIERRVVPLADAVRMAVEGRDHRVRVEGDLLQYLAGRNHRG